MDPALDPLLKDAPTREGRKVLGGVALRRRLGAGKTGVVYFGRHLELRADVALKVVAPPALGSGDDLAELFLSDARAAAAVTHANLVRVHEVGRDAGLCYLVMEHLGGGTVSDLQARQGRVSAGEAFRIALAAAEGLAAAHASAKVHLGVTPRNIVLGTTSDGRSGAVVTDLCLAGVLSAAAARAAEGDVAWAPFYMSPEQTREWAGLGPTTDVWALGVVLYQLLTGSLPWYDVERAALVRKIRHEPPPDLERACPGLPEDAGRIVERALAKDPSGRYAHCGKFAADLRRTVEALATAPGADEPARHVTERTTRIGSGRPAAPDAGAPSPDTGAAPPSSRSTRRGRAVLVAGLIALIAGAGAVFLIPAEMRRREAAQLRALEDEDRAAWRRAKPEVEAKIESRDYDGAIALADGFLSSAKTDVLRPEALALAREAGERREREAGLRREEEAAAHRERLEVARKAAALVAKGAEFHGLGLLEEARMVFVEAVRLAPEKPEAKDGLRRVEIDLALARARALEKSGDLAGALEAYRDLASRGAADAHKIAWLEGELAFREALSRARGLLERASPAEGADEVIAAIDDLRRRRPDSLDVAKLIEEAERRLGPMPTILVGLAKGVVMELVYIPPGRFMMGSDRGEKGEGPAHEVRITKGFYIGKHEVSQVQFAQVEAKVLAFFKGEDRPVESVSWADASVFCSMLPTHRGRRFRLPTEAEWEYACRAGSDGDFGFGDDAKAFAEHGWCELNSGDGPHPVGLKRPNAWGLSDFHGNVAEWCSDWHDAGYYSKGPRDDPGGPQTGTERVVRGGSWNSSPKFCRSFSRDAYAPDTRALDVGFRVLLPAEVPRASVPQGK